MKQFMWLFMAGILFTACANEDKTSTSTESSDEVANEITSSSKVADDIVYETIELDDGNRWKVNEEMKPHVSEGEIVLKNFLSTEDGRTDYASLAEGLQEANNKLIKSCTMEGKSHDELHKWLHPHLEIVKRLKDAEGKEEGEVLVDALQKSLTNYHRHFE